MKTISIKKAETKREMDDFVRFTNWLYADCPYYVPDLEMDIRNTFDPRKNAGLEFSEIQPFIANMKKEACRSHSWYHQSPCQQEMANKKCPIRIHRLY